MRGWERAGDARARVNEAIGQVLREAPTGDVGIVSDGGVGALLLCHFRLAPITRAADQPPNNGGNYFTFD